jgi:hypothetical protein
LFENIQRKVIKLYIIYKQCTIRAPVYMMMIGYITVYNAFGAYIYIYTVHYIIPCNRYINACNAFGTLYIIYINICNAFGTLYI